MSVNPKEVAAEPVRCAMNGAAGGPLEWQAEFLADLVRLAADRAAAETQIEAQRRSGKSAADRIFQESRQTLVGWLETERRNVASDDAEQRQLAVSRFELDSTAIEREYADLQRQAAEEFEAAREHAERRLTETRWEAETLFEASKDVAPRQLKEFEEKIETWLARVRDEKLQADGLLVLWRQPGLESTSETASVSTEIQDFASRLQERVGFVADERVRLAALSVPPLAASLVLVWIYLLIGLLLSAVAAAMGMGALGVSGALLMTSVAGMGFSFFLRTLARSQIEAVYPLLVQASQEAESLAQLALADARAHTDAQQHEIAERRDHSLRRADEKHQSRIAKAQQIRDTRLQAGSTTYPLRLAEIAVRRDRDLELVEHSRAQCEAEIRRRESELTEIQSRYSQQIEQIDGQYAGQWEALVDQWQADLARMELLATKIRGEQAQGPNGTWLSNWSRLVEENWTPATSIPPAIRFGQFQVKLSQIPEGVSSHERFANSAASDFWLPALVPFPGKASLLFQARSSGRRVAVEAMQAFMLRLLVTVPPGKLRFTMIDPVGLGENFAAFMHLADHNEALVSSRIWTEPRHIEQRLADLSEHMENVIQKYLRNEFESIEQYNQDAGEIAEPFRFLVIADFPANFSEAAVRRLQSIVTSGARCGVYTLIMVDSQLPLPAGLRLEDFEQHGTMLLWRDGQFVWKDDRFGRFELILDVPPPARQMTELLQVAGRYANEASRVEVPFEVIAPAACDLWTSSACGGIDVPLGRAGATRLQSLKLGKGTSQHVLVSGKTGSGKSTLLHALITNVALRYSPEEIELYLVDFKQGVEFKTYATHKLPHARVVAIESDREFGLSVLGRLDAELKLRADRFRAIGVHDLAAFRQADPNALLPRILLIVDEFQEFFVEDDKISQDAGLLLDRLVRQGRAFGVHVLLGSQTLAGTYTLARSTIGQMAVRIALQCSEADAHLILSEDNSAARLLSRAGEAIYNDSNGLVEGNHPFQVVWLGDQRREKYLEQVQMLAEQSGKPRQEQIVFEGNLPADPANNKLLAELLRKGRPVASPALARAYLGEAVAIKDPTSVVLRPQSGCNLLVVGQNEDAVLGIFATALVSLSAQHPAMRTGAATFYVFDGSPTGSNQAASLALLPGLTPDSVRLVGWRDVASAINELAVEVERRQKARDEIYGPIYVFVYGLQKLRDLRRQEDDFGFSRSSDDRPADPAKQFVSIVRDGPAASVHALVWCDNLNNLQRAWDRQTLREFEMRVAFQMSATDASTFVDSPLAGKLGVHRALLHSEEEGLLEKFRPYRWPSEKWLDAVRRQLHGSDDAR